MSGESREEFERDRFGTAGKQGESYGWNVEQILVYIWQVCSYDQSEEEYPYKKFRDSIAGKRLRLELDALAARPQEQASHLDELAYRLVIDISNYFELRRPDFPKPIVLRRDIEAIVKTAIADKKALAQASQPPEAQGPSPWQAKGYKFHPFVEETEPECEHGGLSVSTVSELITQAEQAAFQRGQQAMAEKAAQHYPNEIGNMAYCRCGWKGQNWSEHVRSLVGSSVLGAATTTSTQPQDFRPLTEAERKDLRSFYKDAYKPVVLPREEVRALVRTFDDWWAYVTVNELPDTDSPKDWARTAWNAAITSHPLRELIAKWRMSAKEQHESSVWLRDKGHIDDEEYARVGVHIFQLEECADELEAALAATPTQPKENHND